MAVHIALGINARGMRDVLRMWIGSPRTKAKPVFTTLKARGVEDILIAVKDDLTGMTNALDSVSSDGTPDVYRAPYPRFYDLPLPQGPQGGLHPAESDLRGNRRRNS